MNQFRKVVFSILSILLITFVSSCDKPYAYEKSRYLTDLDSFEEFQEKHQPVGQKYSFAYDYTITTKRGIKLTFYYNQFTDMAGQPIIGPVVLEITDLHTKGDMILFDRPSISNGNLLESMGFFNIKASQNGIPLLYKGMVRIEVPASIAEPGMQLFYGEVNGMGQSNWTPAQEDSSSNWTPQGDYRGTLFPPDDLGWINCDRFYGNTDTTEVKVNVLNNPEPSKTAVYVVFDSLKSALEVYPNSAGEFVLRNSPKGALITTIAITNHNTEFYYAVNKNRVGKQVVQELLLAKITEDDLKKLILGL